MPKTRTITELDPTNAEHVAAWEALVANFGPAPDATEDEAPEVDVAQILANHLAAVEAARIAEAVAQVTREVLASVIRNAREARGEARPQVARRAGMTVAQLAGIELGREASPAELRSLGEALGIDALLEA